MTKRDGVPDDERCRAMSRSGGRCIFRTVHGPLCAVHAREGSIQPDEWTQPDNIPVFYVKERTT